MPVWTKIFKFFKADELIEGTGNPARDQASRWDPFGSVVVMPMAMPATMALSMSFAMFFGKTVTFENKSLVFDVADTGCICFRFRRI